MKVIKLIIGILCILLSLFVAFQTFYLGPGNAIYSPIELDRSAAIVAVALLLLGGLIMASTCSSRGVGGEVICILLFSIVTVFVTILDGNYADLRLWAGLFLALAVINLISLFTK